MLWSVSEGDMKMAASEEKAKKKTVAPAICKVKKNKKPGVKKRKEKKKPYWL